MTSREHVEKRILNPSEGYDKVARFYNDWCWTKYWKKIEWPVIYKMLGSYYELALDVGVGTGNELDELSHKAKKIYGVDVSRGMLQECSKNNKSLIDNNNLVLVKESFLEYKPKINFDLILVRRVLSHIDDIDKFVHVLSALCKPNGEVVVSDIHPEWAYNETSIPAIDEKVHIKTCKHDIEDLVSRLSSFFIICHRYEFSFPKQERKLFYIISLKRKPY